MSRSKYLEPEIHKPTTKEVLNSLQSEDQWLEMLRGKNKPYEALIEIVQREAKKREDDYQRNPSIKAIAEQLGQTPAQITKWLFQMYNDLWDLNWEHPESFTGNRDLVNLSFKNTSTGQSIDFTLYLAQPLKYCDRFEWYFIKAKIGDYLFYISEIRHNHSKGKIKTTIFLESGLFNSYREILLEKGQFMELLSFQDVYRLRSFQLDELLRKEVKL